MRVQVKFNMKMTVVEQIYKDIENTFSIHDPVRKYFESRKQEWLQKEKAQQEDLCIHSVVEQGEQLVNFLLYLNDKELINNYDFDYKKEAKKYLKKKITNCL